MTPSPSSDTELAPRVHGRKPGNRAPAAETTVAERTPWQKMIDAECEQLDAARLPRTKPLSATSAGGGDEPPSGARSAVREDEPPDRSITYEFIDRPHRDLFGLALSGGGIRSATFNLGLLQGLHELKLLAAVDYLSTVSGGGYIGGFWSAWLSRQAEKVGFPTRQPSDRVESAAVAHLRRFSNFLSPRVGLLSYDTGRLVVALVSGMIPTVLASLALILGALYAWLIVAQGLFARQIPLGAATTSAWISVIAILIPTAAVLAAFEWRWRARGEPPGRPSTYVLSSTTALVTVAVVWWWMGFHHSSPYLSPVSSELLGSWVARLPLIDSPDRSAALVALLAPAGAWGIASLLLIVWRVTTSPIASALRAHARRGPLDRVLSRLFLLMALWVVGTIVWYTGVLLEEVARGAALTGLAGLSAALSVVVGKMQQILALQPNKGVGNSLLARLRPRLPQISAYLALIAIACAMVLIVIIAVDGGWASWLLIAGGSATVLVLLRFDPNEVGLHSFYRGRLARAYLGASLPGHKTNAEVMAEDDVALTELGLNRPLHLVCCTANDITSSDSVATLRRGAVSAVLSPVGFSVGSSAVRWPTIHARNVPSLATAMTASGAAFNPQMGSKSIEFGPAVTYLMATLNLRLGLWLPHPSKMATTHVRRAGGFPGREFYRELAGLSSAAAPRVHLSDGGHFENMGLFELLRRHCRYIIASDCGADPDVAFDDFGNLTRRAREDLGVEIDVDLAPLRPRADGCARQLMVAGDIHYPDGDVGVLLLFKPTLVGDEPVDVRQYHTRNGDFPHETTGDQFYDEAQWEAYRRLGLHAARNAFRSVVEAVDGDSDDLVRTARIFAHARRQWLPAPEGLTARLPRLTSRAAELDARLYDIDNRALCREVYREVAALRGDDHRTNSAADLAAALHVVREALLFMEEIFVTEELDRRGNHPIYLGIINYFSRWTHSPLVRAWWPMLQALHSQRFAQYLELRLGIATGDSREAFAGASVKDVPFESTAATSLAARSWIVDRGGKPAWEHAGTPVTLSFVVPVMPDSPEPKVELQVAQVSCVRTGSVLAWAADDFLVAPSLWGIGLGEAFLDRIANHQACTGVKHLIVRVRKASRSDAVARKDSADDTQMYRAAGFYEAWPDTGGTWTSGRGPVGVPSSFTVSDGDWRWLCKPLT